MTVDGDYDNDEACDDGNQDDEVCDDGNQDDEACDDGDKDDEACVVVIKMMAMIIIRKTSTRIRYICIIKPIKHILINAVLILPG